VEFPERETPEFISPLLCSLHSPNSPDLNPVDYSVWSILQEKVYKTRITDLDDLKHRIRTEWAMLHHAVIASVASSSFSLCQGGWWSFRALHLILTLCFCDNCSLWILRSLVISNSCRLIFRSDFLAAVSYDVVRYNKWQGKVVTLSRCGWYLLC